MSLDLILIACALAAVSGWPGLAMPRLAPWGQRVAAGFAVCGSLAGLAGAGMSLLGAMEKTGRVFPWPALGNSWIGLDALSAFFLIPIFLMGGLGAIYALGYFPQQRHLHNGNRYQVFWGLMVAGLVILVIARHALAFLFGWEFMALSAFFLVVLEDQHAECRKAGWLYLVATHVCTLTLFGLFAFWRWTTGSYDLQPLAAGAAGLGAVNGIFFLALLGFGLKAGMMPLHFWLPSTHANAPSHVSAMLSGVVIKMGIYGLLRITSLLPNPPASWGALILLLGAVSGVLGVAFAISQHDLKRLLAYHSVENIGIILMGLGLALLGRSLGKPEWVALGLAGCLLHVWNHGFFKGLLFMSAGSVLHATGTRQIDRLGGLAKVMPWTAALFLVGAVAICGLPPLNGFISEWLVYLGLLKAGIGAGPAGMGIAVAAPVLAMIGALAVACFVKVYGAVFLGNARTEATAFAHESPWTMRVPMLVLAAACVFVGLAPGLVAPVLDQVAACWWPGLQASGLVLSGLAPLGTISVMFLALLAGAAVLMVLVLSRKTWSRAGTWDCGYAQPTSRMQYTASSFAQTIVMIFGRVLKPAHQRPRLEGLFPSQTGMRSHVDDAVLDRVIMPAIRDAQRRFGWFRQFQQGLTQHYIFYILVTVVLMLSTLIPFKELFALLMAR